MAQTETSIRALLGTDLSGFQIKEMLGIYNRDADGQSTDPICFFEDEHAGHVFADLDTNKGNVKTQKTLVLTDGVTCYPLTDLKSAAFFGKEEADQVRKDLMGTLTRSQRALLRLPEDI